MKENGLDFITSKEVSEELNGSLGYGVEIDIDTTVDFKDFLDQEMVLVRRTMRGNTYYIDLKHDGETLTFKVLTSIDERYGKYFPDYEGLGRIATTFPDLCWIHSDGTTPENKDEVMTGYRDGYQLGDLTWLLPSKFVDDLVEVMHVLNQSLFEGILQESIVYGPFVKAID